MKRQNSGKTGFSPLDKETRTSKEMASFEADTNTQASVNSLASRDRRDSTVSNESNVSRLSINRRELDRNLAFEPEGPSGPVGQWDHGRTALLWTSSQWEGKTSREP